MESPIEKYKKLKYIDKIKSIAYDTLFVKYVIRDLRGEEKLQEWSSTDQESIMIKKNGGFPLPGFIYTFVYPKKEGKDKIIVDNDVRKYIDFVPIVFCLFSYKEGFSGINLNMLPEMERLKFLEGYYRFYESFFDDIEEMTQNDKLALNRKFISLASSSNSQKVMETFVKAAKSNFEYGFRKYKIDVIRNLRMIEYMEWDYIPFYEPKHAFKKMNQKQIHKLYWDSIKNI